MGVIVRLANYLSEVLWLYVHLHSVCVQWYQNQACAKFAMSSFESSHLKAHFADLRWRMVYQRCTLNWPSTITEQDYSGLDLKLLPCNIQDQLV